VVDDNTPYGKGLADSSAQVIAAAGRKLTLRRSLDDKTTDFAALVQELKASDTQLFVTTLSDFQVEALIDQLLKAGMAQMRILGGDTIKTDRMLKSAGKLPAVYATSSILEAREFLAGARFLEKFRARFKGDPVYGAHYAYDAVYIVADALARNGTLDKATLLERLKSFDGIAPVTSTMRFAADGEQRYAAIGVYLLGKTLWQPLMRSDQW